jgi:hypothetical protein
MAYAYIFMPLYARITDYVQLTEIDYTAATMEVYLLYRT